MIYNLIYGIQEEVHRFTVSKTMNAKRNTLKHSSLEKIKLALICAQIKAEDLFLSDKDEEIE